MKDKEPKNELVIYGVDNKTLVEITHLVESQVKTINTQSKVIQLLEKNAKLIQDIDKLYDELNHERNNHPTEY